MRHRLMCLGNTGSLSPGSALGMIDVVVKHELVLVIVGLLFGVLLHLGGESPAPNVTRTAAEAEGDTVLFFFNFR